ncbi:MAG: hypothetical protein ONA90_05495 [candidate division KSB1 bacterium]|nr:hypothetical protein [candidate division KSB1 bacterium]
MKLMRWLSVVLLVVFCSLQLGCSEKKKNAAPRFVTRWVTTASFKYDLCSFIGILTGRELYKKYYGDLYAEWSRKLPRPVAEAIKKIDEAIGPSQPPGPRLCMLLSAVAAEDSIAAILRAMENDAEVRRLMAADFGSERIWLQWQTIKPQLRLVFEFLQKEQFENYWRKNFYPKITAKLPRIQQELQSYDVIGDLERFLVEADFGDSLHVNVLWLLQPHAVRLTGQRYLTDASYPMHVIVKSAYHETLHPYCERLIDSVLTAQFESLKTDSFLQQIISRADPTTGYRNFKTYCKEELVLAADLWVAERRRVISQSLGTDGIGSHEAARKYLEKHEGGVHVLAAVIYSYLEAGLKLDRMSYAAFLKELFASGRLQPEKIEGRYQEFMSKDRVATR